MGTVHLLSSIRNRCLAACGALLTGAAATTLLLAVPAGTALADCTGCATTNVGSDVVHTYTSGSGTFTAPAGVTVVEYLVVGGGGGGGGLPPGSLRFGAGGGGAGGYLANTIAVTPGNALNVVVGAGGAAGVGGSAQGGDGGNSSFGSVTAQGGGGGATNGVDNDGEDGGSGGGGRFTGDGGSGEPGQGNDGGDGSTSGGAGGGGGAGGDGSDGSGSSGGSGGSGVANDITGVSDSYAAGGDGGNYSGSRSAGSNAAANTGNGGEGATGANGGPAVVGGTGGSGIVIVRYTPPATIPGEVVGNVYRDYNANGERDAGEPSIEGVVVTAYDGDGNSATTVTDEDGEYVILATDGGPSDLSGPVRIEFTLPGDGSLDFLRPGVAGGTSVQFANIDDGAIDLEVGFNNPAQFAPDEAELATSIARAGDATAGGYSEDGEPSVVSIDYDVAVANGVNVTLGNIEDVGSVWGLAYQRYSRHLFSAASLKRHSGFGPLGEGGIYAIDRDNPGTVIQWVDLANIGIDVGTVTRNTGPSTNLPAQASVPAWDQDAYTKVGKVSLGDIDFDEDDQTLWLINLTNRSLYGIQNVDPETTPVPGDVIGPFEVDDSGISCNNGELRPWGLKSHDGKLYVGTVCSGEYNGADRDDLSGHVLEFDRDTGTFTSVLDIDFADPDYEHPMTPSESPRADMDDGDGWQTWYFVDQFQSRDDMSNFQDGSAYKARWAVPMLSDIEFDDVDGSMIVGIKSRFGSMQGQESYAPNHPSTQLVNEVVGAGDILRACLVDGSFELESSSPDCPASDSAANEGPGGNEFYFDDNGPTPTDPNLFREQATGALALLPGRNEVVTSVYDPNEYYSNGLEWYSNTDGSENRSYEIYEGADLPLYGKGHGLGDIELLADAAPVELGNRIWDDYDGDGIQDPGEPGIEGVEVGLYDDGGVLVATAVSDAAGNYLFSNDDRGTTTDSRIYDLDIDARGDYSLAVLDSNFEPGGALESYSATIPDQAGDSNDSLLDVNDSDGVEVAAGSGANSAGLGVSFSNQGPGANNHGFDFGLALYDLGDAPDSYGTTLYDGARHLIARDGEGNVLETLYLGGPPDPESDGQPSVLADGDGNEEDGVTFSSPSGTNNSIFAAVDVVNNTGGPVTVCAWLDVPSGGVVNGVFDAGDGMCQTTSAVNPTLTFQWSGLPTDQAYVTYARFRVTSDTLTTSSATGTVSDGEIEDYRIQFDFTPTLATIGNVNLDVAPAEGFLAGLGVSDMDDAALSELLATWDPEAAASLAGAERSVLFEALMQYLDPDGDGQVAVFRWDTLEERGTIGFYVERREGTDRWIRINDDLLPGLINAPMGAEYLLADPAAQSDRAYEYRLIEQEANGNTRTYGPFTVEMP